MAADNPPLSDDVDLAAIARALLRGWKIVLACLIVSIALASLWMRYAPRVYLVQMLVVPTRSSQTLADAKPTDAGADTPFNLYIQSLHARGLADSLARNPLAMAALSTHAGPLRARPTPSQTQRFLATHLTIGRDVKASPAATISLTTTDPAAGLKLLAIVHQTANEYVRTAAQANGPDATSTTPASPAAQLFDGPYASEQPVSPRLGPAIREAVVAGLLLGGLLVWLRGRLSGA